MSFQYILLSVLKVLEQVGSLFSRDKLGSFNDVQCFIFCTNCTI